MTRHNAALNQQRDTEHRARLEAALTAANNQPEPNTAGTASNHDPADQRHLRGIPAIGGRGSIGGHIQGSRPDQLAWIDERSKRPRTRNP